MSEQASSSPPPVEQHDNEQAQAMHLSSMMVVQISLLLVFFLAVFKNRQSWIIVQSLSVPFGALLVLLPEIFLSNINAATPDEFLTCACRMLGVLEISYGVLVNLLEESTDRTLFVCFSTARILTFLFEIFTMVNYAVFESTAGLQNNLLMKICVSVLLISYDVINMPKLTRRSGSLQVYEPIGFHLCIEGFFTFLLTIMTLAFPEMFLKIMGSSITPQHLLILRLNGSVLLMFSLLLIFSLTFRYQDDVIKMMLVKSAVNLAWVLLGVYWMYVDNLSHASILQMLVFPGVPMMLLLNNVALHDVHNLF